MCQPLNRILSLRGEIEADKVGPIIDQILLINKEDEDAGLVEESAEYRQPIHLHIQSGGGDVLDSFALADVMITSYTPIYTYCDGYVESAAMNVYLAGSKRFVYPHSRFLIHNMRTTLENKTNSNIHEYVEYLNDLELYEIDFLRRGTKISHSEITNIIQHNIEYLFGSAKAIELGVATQDIGGVIG